MPKTISGRYLFIFCITEIKPLVLDSKAIIEVNREKANEIAIMPPPSNIALFFDLQRTDEKLFPNIKPKEPANMIADVTSGIATLNALENTSHQ